MNQEIRDIYTVYKVVRKTSRGYYSVMARYPHSIHYEVGSTIQSDTPMFVFDDPKNARNWIRLYRRVTHTLECTTPQLLNIDIAPIGSHHLKNLTPHELKVFWETGEYPPAAKLEPPEHTLFCNELTVVRLHEINW
jgi:hypothetical protein